MALDRRAISALFEDPNFDKQGFGLWPKGDPWYSPGDALPYDKDAARKLVTAYIKETGKDAAFTVPIGGLGSVAIDSARLSMKYWQDAGFDVKLQILPEVNQVIIALATGQYQAVGFIIGVDKDPDAAAYPPLFSASPLNFARYKSPDMDAALEAGRTAADLAGRKAAYADVQRIFRRDIPFIVGSPGTLHLISEKTVCGLTDSGGFTAKTAGIGNC